MKKLAIIISLAMSTAAFACPNMDHDAAQTTTAKADKKATPAKETKEAPKTDTAKATTPAKDSKDSQKKPDKVSSK